MAGLYIHIPFCKSRCIYCGFYSTTRHELRQRYVDAVCKEMMLKASRSIGHEVKIETVYLGGGTPSQLSGRQLQQIFACIDRAYGMEHVKEVTMECNPDDVTADFVATLAALPVNRVSMGVQTFDDQRLRFLHRRHTTAQISVAVERVRMAGIGNVSIDLMYGFPNETLADWHRDIDKALSIGAEHLSAYSLMYEEGTPLYHLMNNEKSIMNSGKAPRYVPVDEETELQMYNDLTDRLTAAGYEHYEISNFARRGFRSRHNSSYWHQVPYIGIGAAAHSYDGESRQWNVDDVKQYIEGIEQDKLVCEREMLDDDTKYNELIMTSLRCSEGLELKRLSPNEQAYCLSQAKRYLDDGLLVTDSHRLCLTRRGIFVSNMIMSGLMK